VLIPVLIFSDLLQRGRGVVGGPTATGLMSLLFILLEEVINYITFKKRD